VEPDHAPADPSDATWRPGIPRRPTVPLETAVPPEPGEPGSWPDIADYWPDAPPRMDPVTGPYEDPAASLHQVPIPGLYEDPGAEPMRIGPSLLHEQVPRAVPLERTAGARAGRRRIRPLLGVAAAVLLLLGGGAVAYRKVADRNAVAEPAPVAPPAVTTRPVPPASPAPAVVQPSPSLSVSPSPSVSSRRAAPPPAATGPATGTFWLVDDVSEITVSSARVGGGIARVGVPDGSNAVPRATTTGNTIRLAVGTNGQSGRTRIVVQLDNRISWAIRFAGGARTMTVDLAGLAVRSVAFDRGVAAIDLTLPRLGRTLPIRLSGGVNQWRITTAGQVAVDVLAGDGAGQVVLYGRNEGGLARGQRVRVNGRSGIDIDATAGFGTLTVAGT
jgi:hypothetical protein